MLDVFKKNKAITALILVAFVCYMLTILPSGGRYCFDGICGLYFWGAHGHDAIWHLAMVAASFNKIPFVLPTFAGASLGGYNYFIDLVIFVLSKLGISPLVSYFKIIPVVWFVIFTIFLLKLSSKLHKNAIFTFIFLFFVYFSGSFSYVITLFKDGTIWGSSGILTMQPLLSLTNVQFALSIAVLTLILTLIKDANLNINKSLFLGFLVALNLALKFYGGVVSFFIVGLFFVFQFFKNRNLSDFLKNMLMMSAMVATVLFVLYIPGSNSNTGAPLKYSPLSTVYPLIEDPNVLYMKDLTNARYFLESTGKFSPRLLMINFYIVGLSLLLNFGTRIIGIFYIVYKIWKKKLSQFEILVLATLFFSMFLSMFFVQKGIWWNTVQFSYYAFFLSAIFVAEASYMLVKKYRKLGIIVVVLVLLLTIPNSLDTLRSFSQRPGHTYLSDLEIRALNFLKNHTSGIVYSPLPNNMSNANSKQTPLYALGDNAYVTAFSGKQSYIADEVQLELINVDYKSRKNQAKDWNCTTLKYVDYLYEIESNPIGNKLDKCKNRYKRLYKNAFASVYGVNRD